MADLIGSSSAGVGSQYFVMARQGTFNGLDVFTGSHSMQLSVTGPGPIFNVARSSTTGSLGAEISIVGFFAA
jgi:hypothetical protein